MIAVGIVLAVIIALLRGARLEGLVLVRDQGFTLDLSGFLLAGSGAGAGSKRD